MKINKLILVVLAFAVLFTSCSGDDDNSNIPRGNYDNGIIVVNEGNFFSGNATVSFVSNDLNTVEQSIFSGVNDNPLGDTAQSLGFYTNFAYMVVNVSNKIEVVNRYTFETEATISTGLSNPRHIAFSGGKAYVTNWGDGASTTDDYVAVIDLTSNTVESTISVVEGPEEIVERSGKLYITHKGGWGVNNKISIINTTTNNSVSTLNVGDVPDELAFDNAGNLWVLAEGDQYGTVETGGRIVKINTTNDTVETTLNFATTEHPSILDYQNGNIYYYMAGNIYAMPTSATALPTTPILSNVNTNPFSASMVVNGSTLYFTDALDNNSNGKLHIYNLITNTLTDTKTVGINPGGGIYFNAF